MPVLLLVKHGSRRRRLLLSPTFFALTFLSLPTPCAQMIVANFAVDPQGRFLGHSAPRVAQSMHHTFSELWMGVAGAEEGQQLPLRAAACQVTHLPKRTPKRSSSAR